MIRLPTEGVGEEKEGLSCKPFPTRWMSLAMLLVGFGISLWMPLGLKDLWTSFELGQDLLKGVRLAGSDPISWSALPMGNLSGEWLFHLLVACVYRAFGTAGWVLLRGILWAALTLQIWQILARKFPPALALALTGLALGSLAPYSLLKPALVTAVAALWMVQEYEAFRETRRATLWHLPLAMILWSNLHRGSIIGALGLLFLAAGEWLMAWVQPQDALPAPRRRHLLIATGCSLLALGLTPGIRNLWAYPTYLGIGPIARFLMEGSATNFRKLPFRIAELFFILLWLIPSALKVRTHLSERVPALLAFTGLLYTESYLPLFIAMALRSLGWLAAETSEALPALRVSRGNGGWVAGIFVVLGIALWGGIGMHPDRGGIWFSTEDLPIRGVEVIQNSPSGRLLHPAEWGGYLHHVLGQKVFIDARSEAYSGRFLSDYRKMSRLDPGWNQVLERYGFETILWPRGGRLAQLLKESTWWRLIYQDRVCMILKRAS